MKVSESETIHLWNSVEKEVNTNVEVPCDPENDLALYSTQEEQPDFQKELC